MTQCNKKKHNTYEEAKESLNYLLSNNYIENRKYEIYECLICYKWHFGTPSFFDNGWRPTKNTNK